MKKYKSQTKKSRYPHSFPFDSFHSYALSLITLEPLILEALLKAC